MSSIGDTFYILFGIGEDPFSCDKMDNIYSFNDGNWTFHPECQDTIRMRHASAVIDVDKILIYGGIELDTKTKEYKQTCEFSTYNTELLQKTQFKPKKLMLGEFEVVKRLGSGAQGIVYLTKKKFTNELFAVKTMTLNLLEEEEKKSESEILEIIPFIKEIKILEKLNHPNILSLNEYFIRKKHDRCELCFVFPYCEQGDLEKLISKNSHTLDELVN
jgi:serine/threonine protein kinase